MASGYDITKMLNAVAVEALLQGMGVERAMREVYHRYHRIKLKIKKLGDGLMGEEGCSEHRKRLIRLIYHHVGGSGLKSISTNRQ